MKTEQTTNSKTQHTIKQNRGGLSPERNKNAALQYGLSISVGVLTIIILAATYYFGILQ